MAKIITTVTPLADAMAEAEVENVTMRKGMLFDVLMSCAKAHLSGECRTNQLAKVVEMCERTLKEQAEDHARRFPIRR